MKSYLDSKISEDILYTIAITAFVGLFVLANYLFGFNLPLYAITTAVGFYLAARYPRAGLYAIIFLTFIFERFFTLIPIVMGRSEYKIYPVDVLVIAVIFGIILQSINGRIGLVFKKVDMILAVFMSLSVIYFFVGAIILKNDAALAFSTVKNYAFYALLYFIAYVLIDNKRRLEELVSVILISAVGIIWFVLYGIIAGNGLWSEYTPLSTEGVRTLAFTHAFYLCMAFIVAMVYIAYKSDRFSKWFLILMPVWLIGIVGSMMRHLWISILIAIIFLIIMFAKSERRRIKKCALIYSSIAVCIFIVIFYGATLFPRSHIYGTLGNAADMIQSRVVSMADTANDESIVWRSAVWQQAIKQYSGSPVFGIGFGELIPVEIGKYHDFVETRNVHNSFLVLLIQMGIIGSGLLIVFIAILIGKTLKNKIDDGFIQAASLETLGILVFQTVAFMFQPYLETNLLGIFFWINLGIIRRLHELKQ